MPPLLSPNDPIIGNSIFFPAWQDVQHVYFQARLERKHWLTFMTDTTDPHRTAILSSKEPQLSSDQLQLMHAQTLKQGSMEEHDIKWAWDSTYGCRLISWGVGFDTEHRLGQPQPRYKRREVTIVLSNGIVTTWRTFWVPQHFPQGGHYVTISGTEMPELTLSLTHLSCLKALLESPDFTPVEHRVPSGNDQLFAGREMLVRRDFSLPLQLNESQAQRLWELQQSPCTWKRE